MSKKTAKAVLVLTVLAVLIGSSLHTQKIEIKAPSLPIVLASASPFTGPSPSPSAASVSVSKPPSAALLREEIKRDVHVTPPALIRFGADIGERMIEAKKNETAARNLLSELRECAVPKQIEDSPVQARAICIVSAQELAGAWPDLKGDVDQLVSEADPEAVGLAAKIR